MDDYLSYVQSIPNLSPIAVLTLFLLAFLRMAPIVALAPFFGAKVAPVTARAGIAICFSFALLPIVLKTTSHPMTFNTIYIGYMLKELIMGLILGFLISIPFYIAQTSGSLIDFMRGSSFMVMQDITLQVQTSPIGQLYNYILIVLFFELGGPFYFIDALVKSYEIIPADAFLNASFFHPQVPFWKTTLNIMNHILAMAIQISSPALLAILMAETFLGIANRLAPQVQIAFLGISLKSFLGILLLWAGWFFILKQLGKSSTDWLKVLETAIKSF